MVVGDSFCNSGAPFGLEELDLLVEDSLSLSLSSLFWFYLMV